MFAGARNIFRNYSSDGEHFQSTQKGKRDSERKSRRERYPPVSCTVLQKDPIAQCPSVELQIFPLCLTPVNQSKSLIQYFHPMHILPFDQVNFIRKFVFTALENLSNLFHGTIDRIALCVGKVITSREVPAGNLPTMTQSSRLG